MARRSGFVRDPRGFQAVLTSGAVQQVVRQRAEAAAARANSMMGPAAPTDMFGYRATVRSPRVRAGAYVRTGGFTSRRDNLNNNTLLKSIGG